MVYYNTFSREISFLRFICSSWVYNDAQNDGGSALNTTNAQLDEIFSEKAFSFA